MPVARRQKRETVIPPIKRRSNKTMIQWADLFCDTVRAAGLEARVIKRVNGWPETTILAGKQCYTKSITYRLDRRLYFQGVDPKKLEESGDYVLLCGGIHDQLRDIFLIPWGLFFQAIRNGKAINTYKPPKEYWQYKFKIQSTDNGWFIIVQGSGKQKIDVTRWHFDVKGAIQNLSQ